MEVSVCRSPGPVLSIPQEPGGQRAPWQTCRWGQGRPLCGDACCSRARGEVWGRLTCAPPWPAALLSWFSDPSDLSRAPPRLQADIDGSI